MPVFNLCLKIIKKNVPILLIYLVVFLCMSIMVSASLSKELGDVKSFVPTKADVVFISDEDTPLVRGMRDELEKSANFIEIPYEKEALADALYFRNVTSIIHVESGFTQSFMSGENVAVKITNIPNSFSAVHVGMNINQYLNTASLYVKWMDEISEEVLVDLVKKDLGISTTVIIPKKAAEKANTNFNVYYFNFLAYSLLSVLILGIGSIMLIVNQPDIKMRNNSSPFSITRINSQIILGMFIFIVVSWFIMIIFSFLLNFNNSINKNMIYFLLNSLAFTFSSAGLSFLISNSINSKDAVMAACTVVTLGISFISGVFVPQELLGDVTLKIAAVTPTYWYVKANNQIGALSNFNFEKLLPSFYCMIIQICFGILFFALAQIITKRKRVTR